MREKADYAPDDVSKEELAQFDDRFAPEVVGPELSELRRLDAAGKLSDSLLYSDAPHADLSVRSGRDANYELIFRGEKEGDIDRSHLLTEAHTGAVYYHGGKRYKVKAVIEGEKRVILDDARDARDTRPSRTVYVTRKQAQEVHTFGDSQFRLVYGEAVVRQETRGYYEIDEAGSVVGEIHAIPPLSRSFPTLCTWLEIEEGGLGRTAGGEFGADAFPAAHALEHLIQTFVPIHARCDPFDLASDTRRSEGNMVVFLYDNVYGGIGLCRGLVEHTRPVLQQALDAVIGCRCTADEGCSNCIQSKRCFDRMGSVGSRRAAARRYCASCSPRSIRASVGPRCSRNRHSVATRSRNRRLRRRQRTDRSLQPCSTRSARASDTG